MNTRDRRPRPTRDSAIRGARHLPRPWLREAVAVVVVLGLASASWLLVHGVATAVYRHFGSHGAPPLALIRGPGPDPDPAARDHGLRRTASQLGNTGYFWSERAVHYRTVLMFATDDYHPPALLSHDVAQQHPDGVDAWREYTLFMEPLYGGLYRVFGDRSRPVVEFLLQLVPLVHVLLFLPLYAIARALGAGRAAAVGAVAVYASCRLGYARLSGSLLLKEDLALLLLLSFVAAHLWAWRRPRPLPLALAGVLLVAVLISWHLSQFLILIVLGLAALARAVQPPDAGDRRAWWLPVVYLLAGAVAACTPSLAERGFWLSPPFALLVAWALAEVLPRHRTVLGATTGRRLGLLFGGLLLLSAVGWLNRAYTGDYGHVGGLLASKLLHGLRQPMDPGALPFDVRVFWASPFHTPSLGEIWAGVGLQLPLLVGGVVWAAWRAMRPGIASTTRSVLAVVPVLAGGWLLVARLGVVFLPFGALAVALAAQALSRRLPAGDGRRLRPVWTAGAVLCAIAALNVPVHLGDDVRLAREVWRGGSVTVGASDDDKAAARAELFDWVRRQTPGPGGPAGVRPAAFLADVGLSPQLLLYCDRPVALNSQFENAPIRRRYERYLAALFSSDETALFALAREVDADYLIVDRDQATGAGSGSIPYLACVQGPVSLQTTAARLHFAPAALGHFTPVFGNDVYRVFRVGTSARPEQTAWQGPSSLWWRLANYTVADGHLIDPRGDRARLAANEHGVARLQEQQQQLLAQARRTAGSREPELLDLRRHAVLARLAAEDDALTARRIDDLIESRLRQTMARTGRTLGEALASLVSGAMSPPTGEPLFGERAADPLHLAVAGQLHALIGHFDEAAAYFHRAADSWSADRVDRNASVLQAQLRDETVCWLLAAGRVDEARRLAELWRDDLPPDLLKDSFIVRLLESSAVAEVAVR